jgi:diguanylate cyclase (GGDEF)-like protein/PAS domain S-box-containing protein
MEFGVPSFRVLPANETDSFFERVLGSLPDGVYITDRERRITYWNYAAEDLTGFKAEEVLGRLCSDNLLLHIDDTGCLLCEGECPIKRTLVDGLPHREEVHVRHKSGHRVPVEVRVRPIWGGNGDIVGSVVVFADNSRQRAMRERALGFAKFAFLDPASQVGNRSYLEQQLAQQFDQYFKYGTLFGVLLVDLDNFKDINDSHGHAAGDAVLVAVAKILSGCLRASDVVGRWGGDEFLAILPGVSRDSLAKASEKFRGVVAHAPVPVDGALIPVTVSVGAAVVNSGDSLESLLSRVDHYLYVSKQSGRNRVSF